jgi:hypothetical protein
MGINQTAKFAVLIVALCIGITGCGPNIRATSIRKPSDRLSSTTRLSIPYREAYARAVRWAHYCHDISRNHQWSAIIEGSVDDAARTATLHVKRAKLQGGGDFERLDFAAASGGTDMQVVVNNTKWWGRPELQAAETSVKTNTPNCHWMFDHGTKE